MESKTENLVTSAAAFVEGGIQESCDDACSICLEEFCDNDPSTVILTNTCIHRLFEKHVLTYSLSFITGHSLSTPVSPTMCS
jgi:E3 ubiquitin-protein ligase RHF